MRDGRVRTAGGCAARRVRNLQSVYGTGRWRQLTRTIDTSSTRSPLASTRSVAVCFALDSPFLQYFWSNKKCCSGLQVMNASAGITCEWGWGGRGGGGCFWQGRDVGAAREGETRACEGGRSV